MIQIVHDNDDHDDDGDDLDDDDRWQWMDTGWHKISTILLNCTDQLLESSALEEIVGRTSQCNDVHWALESSTSFSADQRSCSREFHQSEDTDASTCLLP